MKTKQFHTYLVGGAVRDKLLQLPIKERDWVVVGATVEGMLQQGFRQVGRDFPVFLHPKTQEEYALARTERKQGRGYTGFVVHADPNVTLEEDLLRRDLTINAIAEDEEGNIIDPYQGVKDLQQKILRHVSPAFIEDPLRVLRLARFYARFANLGFTVAEETLELTKQMVLQGELQDLTAERVWQECHRALQTDAPEMFFQYLHDCGAMKVLFPELENLFGVPNPKEYHPEVDSGIHTLMVLHQAAKLSNNPMVRFAALMHDVGKAATDPAQWPSHKMHDLLGVPLIEQFAQRYKIPNDYLELAKMVCRYHLQIHQAFQHKEKAILKLLEKLDAFRRPQRFLDCLIACEADARGRLGREDEAYRQRAYLIQLFQAAQNIEPKELIQPNMNGMAIANAIHTARLNAIKKLVAPR